MQVWYITNQYVANKLFWKESSWNVLYREGHVQYMFVSVMSLAIYWHFVNTKTNLWINNQDNCFNVTLIWTFTRYTKLLLR